MSSKLTKVFIAGLCCMFIAMAPAAAVDHPPCPSLPSLSGSDIDTKTNLALGALKKIIANAGLEFDFRVTRNNILKDNPQANQIIIVLTMANTLCEMIWSDSSLTGETKALRFKQMMESVLALPSGPTPVGSTAQKQSILPLRKVVLAANDSSFTVEDRKTGLPDQNPFPENKYIKTKPFYINKYNKYFVVVGSAKTQDDGVALMKRLKQKAPKYDFVLFAPYDSNAAYGVMMAAWVSRPVANEALGLARRDVSADAFLWACRSTGENC